MSDQTAAPASLIPPDIETKLGTTLISMLTAQHGADAARAFAVSITEPTFPGTLARTQQDAVWGKLTSRLLKVAGEPA